MCQQMFNRDDTIAGAKCPSVPKIRNFEIASSAQTRGYLGENALLYQDQRKHRYNRFGHGINSVKGLIRNA